MACPTLVVILACMVGLADALAFVSLIGYLAKMRAHKEPSLIKIPELHEPKSPESGYARLPSELRVLIFEHYFQAHTYILDPLREFRPPAQPSPPLPNSDHSNVNNLLRTCSQIYHEAGSLITTHTTFKTFLRYESVYDFLLAPPLAPNGKIEHLIIHYRNITNMLLAPIVRALPDLETIVIAGDTHIIRRCELPHAFDKRLRKVVTEADFAARLKRKVPEDVEKARDLQMVLGLARKPLQIELVHQVGAMNNGDVIVYRPIEQTWVRKRLDVATQLEYGFDEGRYRVPYGRVGGRKG